MSQLGGRPGGSTHIVFTDLREELVVYVNGRPYLRRELEMPSAALHHAGIWHLKSPRINMRLGRDKLAQLLPMAQKAIDKA